MDDAADGRILPTSAFPPIIFPIFPFLSFHSRPLFQGDKERELGLPYSPLCDRNTTLIAESQIGLSDARQSAHRSDTVPATSGFIDFIVAPSLEVCGELLDKIYSSEYTPSQEAVCGRDDAKDVRYQSLTAIPDPTASIPAEKGQESSSGEAAQRYVSKLIPHLEHDLIFLVTLYVTERIAFLLCWIFRAPMPVVAAAVSDQ